MKSQDQEKCECLFRLCGYVHRETKKWWLIINNGVHNYKMESKLVGHIHVNRLRGERSLLVT